MKGTIEEILVKVRKLTPQEKRQLASAQLEEAARENKEEEVPATLAILEETRGSIKGLDRETIIWLAEDEGLCGY